MDQDVWREPPSPPLSQKKAKDETKQRQPPKMDLKSERMAASLEGKSCVHVHKPTTMDTGLTLENKESKKRKTVQIKTRKKETLMCPFSVHEGEVKKQNQPMVLQKEKK